jgi:hypothetical protein
MSDPATTRQKAVCKAIAALTYAEMIEVARWLAWKDEGMPDIEAVENMARDLQNLAENFERL